MRQIEIEKKRFEGYYILGSLKPEHIYNYVKTHGIDSFYVYIKQLRKKYGDIIQKELDNE